MSGHEIEILHAKQSFIVKITNRVIASIFIGSIGIVWAIAYYCGGFVSQVHDHEKRITNIEQWRNSGQASINAVKAMKNANVQIKNGE